MPPPAPPLPKMDGLYFWVNHPTYLNYKKQQHQKQQQLVHNSNNNNNNNNNAEISIRHQQVGTQQIYQAEMSCIKLKQELEKSRKTFQLAKNNLIDLKEQIIKKKKKEKEQLDEEENKSNSKFLVFDKIQQEQKLQQFVSTVQQSKIQVNRNAWNYRLCIANTLCPRQTQMYGQCWKFAVQSLGEHNLKLLQQQSSANGGGSSGLQELCRPERDMLQRCIGRHVALSVEEQQFQQQSSILDSSDNDLMDFVDDAI